MKKTIGQIIVILFAALFLAVAVNLLRPNAIAWVQDWDNYTESKARKEQIKIVSLREAVSLHQKSAHLFVDARPEEAFERGHVEGACSVPFHNLDANFDVVVGLLDSEQPLIIYCTNRECDDALMLALELREMGKSNLFYYVDGFEVWQENGLVVEVQVNLEIH